MLKLYMILAHFLNHKYLKHVIISHYICVCVCVCARVRALLNLIGFRLFDFYT